MQNYVSSIIYQYGDTDKVSKDVKILNEILGRQGSQLLLDVVAENAGNTANTYSLNDADRNALINNLVSSLKEALKERL